MGLPGEPARASRQRWEALDDLRGLAILVMVPVNVAATFASIPAWFKHAPADGLTLPDFVVPAFLFSLGLSASFSYGSRVRDRGFSRTLLHAFIRYAVLFAFGSIGILLVDHASRWETLQMLGATGLLSFFFLPIPPWPRIAAAAVMLAAVEVLRPLGLGALLQGWYETGLGGPWGTFSLSFFAVTASALGELLRDESSGRRLAVSGVAALVLGAAGLAALDLAPLSKHLLSLSYILFTAGVSSALLCFLVLLRELAGLKLPVAASMGRNALLLYMLHAVIGVGAQALLGDGASAGAAWAASLLVLAVCAGVALVLDRRKIYLKL
jgi:predicted acyltransferase